MAVITTAVNNLDQQCRQSLLQYGSPYHRLFNISKEVSYSSIVQYSSVETTTTTVVQQPFSRKPEQAGAILDFFGS